MTKNESAKNSGHYQMETPNAYLSNNFTVTLTVE
jgi:hypothetical protein